MKSIEGWYETPAHAANPRFRAPQAGRRTAQWIIPASRARIAARDAALWATALPGVRRLLRPVLTPIPHSLVRRQHPA
jgi:hypothetical protein